MLIHLECFAVVELPVCLMLTYILNNNTISIAQAMFCSFTVISWKNKMFLQDYLTSNSSSSYNLMLIIYSLMKLENWTFVYDYLTYEIMQHFCISVFGIFS